ncbi:MAG: amidohydrolase family protein [Candidatus Brocadiaceae bacterium]
MGEAFIDAYAHVGVPRFGTAEEVVGVFDRNGIEKGILVLGPGIPDLAALQRAREVAGERIRCMGIPFGATEEQRNALADVQLRIGISGMRFMPDEIRANAAALQKLGERGLWLFAINPHRDGKVTRILLDWLDRFPDGRIASPHFLTPQPVGRAAEDPRLLRDLLSHERFHAIFSRHGGVGSVEPYPHRDLLPWVEEVVEIVTWDRIMWGSEYPVLFWRNESVQEAQHWIDGIGICPDDGARARFLHANAQRLFFEDGAPPAEPVRIPAWVGEQFNRTGTVPLMPRTTLHVPMTTYRKLLSGYLQAQEREPPLRFCDYLVNRLSEATHRGD